MPLSSQPGLCNQWRFNESFFFFLKKKKIFIFSLCEVPRLHVIVSLLQTAPGERVCPARLVSARVKNIQSNIYEAAAAAADAQPRVSANFPA